MKLLTQQPSVMIHQLKSKKGRKHLRQFARSEVRPLVQRLSTPVQFPQHPLSHITSHVFHNYFIANCPQNASVKDFWKSVNNWRRYGQK